MLIKARADKLVAHLLEERDTALDPHYDEDFLLMYRVFIDSALNVFGRLLRSFDDEPTKRDKVRLLYTLRDSFRFIEMYVDRWRASSSCG